MKLLCEVMGVHRSGYYAYINNRTTLPNKGNGRLIIEATLLHKQAKGAYGSRRLAIALSAKGFKIGRYKTRTLMRQIGISCKQRRRYRFVTSKNNSSLAAKNILNRKFNALMPNAVWTSDITYIDTREGWLYVAVVLDAFARRVVGWSFSSTMHAELVCDAYLLAQARRQPGSGLLHHSDQGSQYTSEVFRKLLNETGATASMSRRGNCWDNAITERFFGTLKSECTTGKNYSTREQAKADIVEFIEMFYNSKRLHSALDYLSPLQYEMNYKM